MIHTYFVQGREAYKNRTGPDIECPYPEGSEARKSWNAGWDHEWFEDHHVMEKL